MTRCATCDHPSSEHYPLAGKCRHNEHGSVCPCPGFKVPLPA